MEDTTKKAFSEVYNIIKHMNKQMQEKIPSEFMNLINNNRDLRIYT